MADLQNVIYLSNADYETLVTTGTVVINGTTLTYNENNLYITPDADYQFTGGTNKFTVTFPDGSTQDVAITPSITNNITGTGTSGYLAKFNGTNTITNGPQLGSNTTTFLRNDGSWATPAGTYSLPTATTNVKGGVKIGTGLSMNGEVLNHSNSITAQATQAVYPIKIDAQGHISGYGNAVTTTLASDTGTSTVTLAYGGKYKLTAAGSSVIFTMPSADDTNTATAADNILDGSNSGTQITYAPYTSQQDKLSFDTSSTYPSRTDRLNLNGYLYATRFYSKEFAGDNGGAQVCLCKDNLVTTSTNKVGTSTALTTSDSEDEWLKALLVALCTTYTGKSGLFRGYLSPNSKLYYEVYIYNTSEKDSTGLPRYAFGTYSHWSTNGGKFGTNNYTFWRYDLVHNAGTWNISITGSSASCTGTAVNANYVNLYEDRSATTSLNKAANYIGAGKMFHLVASSTTTEGKTPTDANILQMNWDNNGGYDSQFGISTSNSRAYFRSQASAGTDWQEIAHAKAGAAVGGSAQAVYMSNTGVITAIETTDLKAGKDGDGNTITSKYVTLDTAQTISGAKTFSAVVKATHANGVEAQKFQINNSSNTNTAYWQFNSTDNCIDLIFN